MPVLELKYIRKSFGAVQALKGVNLSVGRGEVHALVGENGAGKSTLMKILSGAYHADSGEIVLNGKPCVITSPAQGRQAGIAMIYQELNICPDITVAENICLGIEPSKAGFIRIDRKKVADCLESLGRQDIDLDRNAGAYKIGVQQVIEIARAIYSDASVIIMDEPTSSLSSEDTAALFRTIGRLKEKGISIIYISHFLEEVKEISDSFTVLRDGESVAAGKTADCSISEIVEFMVGRKLDELYHKVPHELGRTVFDVSRLSGAEGLPANVSFSLRRGEVFGIAGLVGSGRTETLRSIFGLDKAASGEITLKDGARLKTQLLSPRRSLDSGLDMLSENRKEEGLATSMSISDNITLSKLGEFAKFAFLNLREEFEKASQWCSDLGIKCRGAGQPVSALSGGNQQKVAIARMLNHDSDIFLMDEPTRGIDVGSKAEIYGLIMKLVQKGKSVVIVSSYLPELLGICDTIAVMHRGRMSSPRPASEWDEHEIMLFATSGADYPTILEE